MEDQDGEDVWELLEIVGQSSGLVVVELYAECEGSALSEAEVGE